MTHSYPFRLPYFYWLVLCFFILRTQPVSGQYDTDDKKAKFFLDLCKKYSPDAFEILNSDTTHSFTQYATDGSTTFSLLNDIGTVVHETCHGYNFKLGFADGWGHNGYFISTTCKIACPKGHFFNSSVLNTIVPGEAQKKIFRYKLYVSGESKNSSTVEGVYGFTNEFTAYYHDVKIYMELLPFYETRCSYQDATCWADKYISAFQSSLYAFYEFRLFIAWYLEYAEVHEKKIFDELINNQNLRVAFTLVEGQYKKLIDGYFLKRQQITEKLIAAGNKIIIKKEFYSVAKENGSTGYGIPDETIVYLKSLYTPKEETMLGRFRVNEVTLSNFKTFVKKTNE
ncbi:MAG: hypothetical protein JSS93_01875 [Bacteroidetes bacterium]|nr:hypothetical protein [Bacteroidota bacterium]